MAQIIIAGLAGFLITLFLTGVLIKRFSADGIGQEIREDGPQSHLVKQGTPTMGGIAILAGILGGYLVAILAGYLSSSSTPGVTGWVVLFLTLGLGLVGFLDDYIKVVKQRNLGLSPKAKLLGQLIITIVFVVLILNFPNRNSLTPADTRLSFVRDLHIDMSLGGSVFGLILFAVFIFFLVAGWSNGVNLTDGLDGLASGIVAIVLGVYVVLTFWQFRNSCSNDPTVGCYEVRDPLDLSILCAAGFGACLAFLWWNGSPAQIFMGDTGSLALGGLLAGISATSHTELLMLIVGGVIVAEALSVIIQVVSFKTRGKRVFKMAPLHHHFEQMGWLETKVVIRMWIISIVFAFGGSALFYGEWLNSHPLF